MNTLWDQLDALRAIVDTAQADDIERQPEAIRTRYEPYAQAYFAIEAVKRVEERLIGELRAGRSVTGYLSADFGYGKTATAIYLWKECLDSGIVAVPPFLFRQLKGLMQATRGWLAYLLQHTQPALLPRLEETYRQHAERSVDELAKDIAARQGISEAKARAIVQEHIANRRDVTTTQSLLEFLRDAVGIAQEAGFKGLVVFADELQEFVRTEERARDTIQTLSELVKGVRAMTNVPLGLILAMPVTPTETTIEEQAGDIMQRMRERGTALKLEDAYGREFPKALWEHLSQKFGDGGTRQAVEERTLEALGQLCERKDLSNGPRTVMNAFKRIAQHYQQTRRPYSPIDLIDDYLHGHIVFEGREAKLTGTLRQLLELPAVRNDAQRQQAVKLLAAFPRGVDKEKAGHLYDVIQNLADWGQWLGEHITQLAEGYALIGLQERGEARPLLDEIVRDFRRKWYHSWNEKYKAQLAASGFIYEIVPLLFPARAQGQYANFSGHVKSNGPKNPEKDVHGVPYMLLEGCFESLFSRFPDRKVYVSVSTDANSLNRFRPPDDDFDLDIRFFLELPEDNQADATLTRIESANQDSRVDVHLNLKRTFGRQFPPELSFLRDIMSPERTSAELLLGLSMRMWGWLQEHSETGEADRLMIESQRRALHRYVLQLLLPDANDPTKVQTIGIKVSGAEQRLIESIFEAKCSERYPQYKPLMITKEWKSHLQRYRDVLSRRPLAERRGRQPFAGTKQEIASEFRWAPATFEAQSRNLHEMGVFELLDWRGRGEESEARVLFKEHPLEAMLRETLQQQGRVKSVNVGGHAKQVKGLEISTLRKVARRQGYLPEEVDEAIALLELRQYIERQPDGTVQEFAGLLDADELRHQASEMEGRLEKLATHFRDELHSYERLLREIREHLAESEDEVVLDTAQRKLHELQVRLDEFIKHKSRELAKRLSSLGEELDRRTAEFQPHELDQQVAGAVEFVRRVDDLRKKLGQQFRELSRQWDLLQESVNQSEQRARTIGDEDDLLGLITRATEYEKEKQHLDGELKRLQPYLAGLEHWRSIVAKATALRDRLDLDNPLRQRLDDDVSQAILENFAVRQLDALLDWERFKARVEAIEAEISAEESRQRNEFHQRKEQYEQVLGQLTPQRMIQATFDPKDPGQSYQVLYQGALRKLREWLHEQCELAQGALNELDYLIRERGIVASNERDTAEHVLKAFQQAAERLNQGLIEDLEQFQAYCNELQGNWEQLRAVQNNLAHKRTAKDPPTDEEKPLLEVLSTQRRSLEDLRRQLPANMATIEMLFERLRELYRKGHIEVEVRKRE
uniref:Uncharacterized protein n=1 Tax=uncultured prokaryote TaxID=198431 RepID=H5SCM9_9ZZZZ|nr:hypothetical protein HGMM_F11C09C23 [uncultured prokaryote]